MENVIAKLRAKAMSCPCGRQHGEIAMEAIVVEADALEQAVPYLLAKAYKRVVLVADANTYRVAGHALMERLQAAGIGTGLSMAQANENGDVVADEPTIVQVMLDVPREGTGAIIAVGSGTIHDIVRIVAYKMAIPFVSVPTAPSVDGFTSVGAPLILRGEKKTVAAVAPVAIFADLTILKQAPKAMVAAGFGDMMGKFTSLFDWRFGALTASEPYCQAVAEITRSALNDCVGSVEEIAGRSEAGIRALTVALIESGLAMLLLGQSHSASGSEHHISHYWEMAYIRRGKRQLLHGAKVGVASALIAELYRGLEPERIRGIAGHAEEIRADLAHIPDAAAMRGWLREVGGPATPEELGIDPQLVALSLSEAHNVRLNRYTLLRAYNETRSHG